jgi:RimJ/RimL family protein N-acetyltransferase
MFIRSERLFLRPIWAEDWQDLHAGLSDQEVERNFLRMGWPYSPEGLHSLEGLRKGDGLDPRMPHFMITLPRGNHGVDVLGMIGMVLIDGQAHLGYWIAREHRGQGYATEAGRAVLALAHAGPCPCRCAPYAGQSGLGPRAAQAGLFARLGRWCA